MRQRFFDIAFTPAVQAEQLRQGSREAYAAAAANLKDQDAADSGLDEREVEFLAERNSFYLASVSETGWPYVQHRGGPVGFVRRLNDRTIGWAEFAGNRQYVSVGNSASNDRVAMIFMDYPNRRRLKVLGHLRSYDAGERPDLVRQLSVAGDKARVERVVTIAIDAFDWNCPQHITPRYALAEIEPILAPLHAKIAELEAQLNTHAPVLG